jgi:nucleotide-binding universal stress UspA family protein
MIEVDRILYATDFSELSEWALGYAIYLARQCSAELHCVHVVDDSYQYWMTLDAAAIPAGPPIEQIAEAAEKQLGEFVSSKVPAELTVVKKIVRGRPFVQIIRYAREKKMDLTVLGTHGHSGLTHILMGSVAEKVVRKSPCPVLTIRHPDHEFEMP